MEAVRVAHVIFEDKFSLLGDPLECAHFLFSDSACFQVSGSGVMKVPFLGESPFFCDQF